MEVSGVMEVMYNSVFIFYRSVGKYMEVVGGVLWCAEC